MNNTFINKKIKIASALLLIAGLLSCNKFLDVDPKDQITDNTLWGATGNADLFLNNIYAGLPDPYNVLESEDTWTDNAMAGYNYYVSRTIYARSEYTPSNAPNYWIHFDNVRKCNVFIENVTASTLPDAWKKQRLAEARFLRAYFYQLLWTHYGGVPIITVALNKALQGDSIFAPRNTDEETFEFIDSECAAIADDLPLKSDAGRVTKGAVLALKGWCELFEASALKNPENDKTKWALAAATNKQL
ncbi:MAG TPA: RagB/SusD family nutrient uptake outer membrane protein, partial [Flavitalea sp.]|nr:RagB/SusD family nutrient uptake outer membrane protein [Flavitalea sp.]